MKTTYSDPTANAAVGAVDRELRRRRAEAECIAQRVRRGEMTAKEIADARRRFTGIYKLLLERALKG